MDKGSKLLSDVQVFSKYSKYIDKKNRRETWDELVDRNKEMHITHYANIGKQFSHELRKAVDDAYELVRNKLILPSMRSMQFSGTPIEKNPARMYNCSYAPVDNISVFGEAMFLLLGGSGFGYSVQKHHVDKLPKIKKASRHSRYLVGDSIEGWAYAVDVLVKSFFGLRKSIPRFDYSDIRKVGTPLSSGGKAPGPKPLRDALMAIESLLLEKEDGDKLTPIEVNDMICRLSDAVLAGGIRRSSLISLFSPDDKEMLYSKSGNWWELYPYRGRANNSAVMLRDKTSYEDFSKIYDILAASGSGEPGFFFTNDLDWGLNPCAEVSLKANGFCNLTNVNATDVKSDEELQNLAYHAAIIGTLQSGYTDFHYLRSEWNDTADDEALIGVGLTGIASGNVLSLNLKDAVNAVEKANKFAAEELGLNTASRLTVVKPDGNSGALLGTSSGVHAWHSKYFIRRIRLNKEEELYKKFMQYNPHMVEDDVEKPDVQAIVSFPIKAPDDAIVRDNETAIGFLERVKYVYNNWVKPGSLTGANANNVSCTVSVKEDEWDTVKEWMWNNRDSYTAISLLPYSNMTYKQMPFEEITETQYNDMTEKINEMNLDKIYEKEDFTHHVAEAACAGGSCELVL